jgi:SAM-dependent methyltransferase
MGNIADIRVRTCDDFGSRQSFVIDRSHFQQAFVQLLLSRAKEGCVVLDVGCGSSRPRFLQPIEQIASAIDGVDPSADVAQHTALRHRWNATLEDADIPEETYDIAFAYNVVEHVSTATSFLEKIHRVLKPGGVFLALTPHWHHPFPRAVRLVERMSLKARAAKMHAGVNSYPAYYRLNSLGKVRKATPEGYSQLTVWRVPCRQWDSYFPKRLRFLPHVYDFTLGDRVNWAMLIFIFELQKQNNDRIAEPAADVE